MSEESKYPKKSTEYLEVKINDTKYKVKLLSMSRTLETTQMLVKLNLPALGAALDGGIVKDQFDEDYNPFLDVALSLTQMMGEVDVAELIAELLDEVIADGEKINADDYFVKKKNDYVELLIAVLKETYADFFMSTLLNPRLMKLFESLKQIMQPTSLPTE